MFQEADVDPSLDGGDFCRRVLSSINESLSFAFPEMLAAPRGAKALSEIRDNTELGHGLYTVDGCGEGLEQTVVGSRASSCLG
jgi:hypothetical protein